MPRAAHQHIVSPLFPLCTLFQMAELSPEASVAGSPVEAHGEQSNVKVMVRVRLFNSREIDISAKEKELIRSCVKMRDKTCVIVEHTTDDKGFPIERERDAFDFDECFWSLPAEQQGSAMPFATQQYVYERSGLLAMQAAFQGFNVCIFAYGQTGSGKTYSMLGTENDPGISPRLVDDLFAQLHSNPMVKSSVECMFYEIYNEKCRDLFNKKSKVGEYDAPKIRQHPTRGVFVEGLIRKEVATADVTKRLIEKGTKERAMAETKMNAHSSRSHAIFQIQLIQNDAMKGTQKVSTINLVDLAGSEKIKLSGAAGDVLTEAKNINQSLSTLRKVIDVLIENSTIKQKKNRKIPPFRESVLTWVLSDSLGGNSKTMMISTISPHECNIEDTLGTLRYALRAKSIVCNARVNEEKSAAMLDSMRDEILALQQKLRDGGGKGMSSDIKKEIEMREAEVRKMEETQHEMESALAEAKEKEVAMTEALKQADEAKAELNLNFMQQKRERFATAFRNAFLLSAEKKKIESSHREFEALQQSHTQLEEERKYLSAELQTTRACLDDLQRTTEAQNTKFAADMAQRDAAIGQFKRQVANQSDELGYLRDQNDKLVAKVQGLDGAKAELERRVQRLQEEVLVANAAIDREKTEKSRAQAHFESNLQSMKDELENLRKRKDKYKQMFMEINAKAEARTTVINALQEDRESFLTTIKAQQGVVAEHGSNVQRVLTERRVVEQRASELESKLHRKDEDARAASEALREYQSAAAEWMYENHAVNRELQRVAKGYDDLKEFVETSQLRGGATVSQGWAQPAAALSPVTSPPAAPTRYSPSPARGVASPAVRPSLQRAAFVDPSRLGSTPTRRASPARF